MTTLVVEVLGFGRILQNQIPGKEKFIKVFREEEMH